MDGVVLPMEKATYKSFVSPDKRKIFHGRFGTCFDDVIQEQLNCYVPKNKSYLTKKELIARKKKHSPQTEVKSTHLKMMH
jgi:hypothetical protein